MAALSHRLCLFRLGQIIGRLYPRPCSKRAYSCVRLLNQTRAGVDLSICAWKLSVRKEANMTGAEIAGLIASVLVPFTLILIALINRVADRSEWRGEVNADRKAFREFMPRALRHFESTARCPAGQRWPDRARIALRARDRGLGRDALFPKGARKSGAGAARSRTLLRARP